MGSDESCYLGDFSSCQKIGTFIQSFSEIYRGKNLYGIA